MEGIKKATNKGRYRDPMSLCVELCGLRKVDWFWLSAVGARRGRSSGTVGPVNKKPALRFAGEKLDGE